MPEKDYTRRSLAGQIVEMPWVWPGASTEVYLAYASRAMILENHDVYTVPHQFLEYNFEK